MLIVKELLIEPGIRSISLMNGGPKNSSISTPFVDKVMMYFQYCLLTYGNEIALRMLQIQIVDYIKFFGSSRPRHDVD